MCTMISGPKQPGKDIDVYLAPLIEDLKMLWNEGVDVFDAYKKETFKLRALFFRLNAIIFHGFRGILRWHDAQNTDALTLKRNNIRTHNIKV